MGARTAEAGGKAADKSKQVFATNASVSGICTYVEFTATACSGKKSKITGKNIAARMPKPSLFNLPPIRFINFLFYSDNLIIAKKQ